MNEMRINNEEEKELIEGHFKYSLGATLIWAIGCLILAVPALLIFLFVEEAEVNGAPVSGWGAKLPLFIPAALVWLAFNVVQIIRLIAIKRNKLHVTNKRIYGAYSMLFVRKEFSYRLDEIDNVEMASFLGKHTLNVQFSQGAGPINTPSFYANGVRISGGPNCFSISYLANEKEIYNVLNNLLKNTKNLIDLETDLKVSRIEAENRKADALETVAKNLNPGGVIVNDKPEVRSDYIQELRELKKLLDEGIITQEEFDSEKKEILENNHK